MRTIAVNIEKGGVGKTTIACHLAWYLAERSERVAVLDLDQQGDASSALSSFQKRASVSALFADDFRLDSEAGHDLFYNDQGLNAFDDSYDTALTSFRENMEMLAACYDYCIIDTPPNWSWINFGALMVCDAVLVPLQLEQFAVRGVQRISDSIQTVVHKGRGGRPILLAGIVPSRLEHQNELQMNNLDAVRTAIGDHLFTNYLPARKHFSEAMQTGVPVWKLDKDTRSSRPFMEKFLAEAMDRIENRKAA